LLVAAPSDQVAQHSADGPRLPELPTRRSATILLCCSFRVSRSPPP